MATHILIAYGQTVREIRQSKDMSQETLADLCGLHRTYISDVELGKRNISLENIDRMAVALGITLPQLFERIEKNDRI